MKIISILTPQPRGSQAQFFCETPPCLAPGEDEHLRHWSSSLKQLRWDVAVMPPTIWYGSSYTRELYLEQEKMEFLRRVAIGSRAECD